MKITIEIPKEFEQDFKNDRFRDVLERFITDVDDAIDYDGLAGNYEVETALMLEEAFRNAKIVEE